MINGELGLPNPSHAQGNERTVGKTTDNNAPRRSELDTPMDEGLTLHDIFSSKTFSVARHFHTQQPSRGNRLGLSSADVSRFYAESYSCDCGFFGASSCVKCALASTTCVLGECFLGLVQRIYAQGELSSYEVVDIVPRGSVCQHVGAELFGALPISVVEGILSYFNQCGPVYHVDQVGCNFSVLLTSSPVMLAQYISNFYSGHSSFLHPMIEDKDVAAVRFVLTAVVAPTIVLCDRCFVAGLVGGGLLRNLLFSKNRVRVLSELRPAVEYRRPVSPRPIGRIQVPQAPKAEPLPRGRTYLEALRGRLNERRVAPDPVMGSPGNHQQHTPSGVRESALNGNNGSFTNSDDVIDRKKPMYNSDNQKFRNSQIDWKTYVEPAAEQLPLFVQLYEDGQILRYKNCFAYEANRAPTADMVTEAQPPVGQGDQDSGPGPTESNRGEGQPPTQQEVITEDLPLITVHRPGYGTLVGSPEAEPKLEGDIESGKSESEIYPLYELARFRALLSGHQSFVNPLTCSSKAWFMFSRGYIAKRDVEISDQAMDTAWEEVERRVPSERAVTSIRAIMRQSDVEQLGWQESGDASRVAIQHMQYNQHLDYVAGVSSSR